MPEPEITPNVTEKQELSSVEQNKALEIQEPLGSGTSNQNDALDNLENLNPGGSDDAIIEHMGLLDTQEEKSNNEDTLDSEFDRNVVFSSRDNDKNYVTPIEEENSSGEDMDDRRRKREVSEEENTEEESEEEREFEFDRKTESKGSGGEKDEGKTDIEGPWNREVPEGEQKSENVEKELNEVTKGRTERHVRMQDKEKKLYADECGKEDDASDSVEKQKDNEYEEQVK